MNSLDPQLIAKLTEIDKKYNPQVQQLQVLSDIAVMMHELINVSDDTKSNTDQLRALGAVLVDARQQLVDLNGKNAQTQDFSKPIVDAVDKLSREIKLQINRPQPNVNVATPDVKIDLSKIEQLLKHEIPKAFKSAIDLIPQPETIDNAEILGALADIAEWLKSIDKASRLKPQAPTQIKVVNPDGSNVGAGGIATVTNDGTFATPARQDTGNTSLSTIAGKDFATQTTLALIKAKTDNLDVALSTRTKPADAQHVIVDSGVTTGLTDTQLRATPVPVSGTVTATTGGLTDTQLRASAVPVSNASLPLPTGASTATNQLIGLVPKVYDYINADYSGSTADVYTYKAGGAGGSTAATLTVNWTDVSKSILSSVVRV